MTEDRVQRKLTTILAADVEGYTRLMRADEEATLKTLGEYRETIDALVARHDGRVFSTGGDSVLAEFGSAVEAVRCAISWQEEMASRNADLADDRKLMFRIGINVGDVMIRDDDLFGDGVNVAARLERLVPAGGAHQFPEAASFRISFSSVRSDTALRRRWFSFSSSFRRFA